jgi:hypothetical protein
LILTGRKFIARLEVEKTSDLILPSTDPRRLETKPDVYVGTVEETGPRCEWVTQGQKVAFLRFEYGSQSADIGENRVVVDEQKDVMILGDSEAAPGIVAVNVIEKEAGLEIPEWVKMNNEGHTLFGQVVASGWACTPLCIDKWRCTKQHVNVDDLIWFRRLPDIQYRLGEHTIIFDNLCRHCRDHAKMDCPGDVVLARMDEVVVPRMMEVVQ